VSRKDFSILTRASSLSLPLNELPLQLERALERPVGRLAAPGVITTLEIFSSRTAHRGPSRIVAGALRSAPLAPLRWLASGYVEFFSQRAAAGLDVFLVFRRAAVIAARRAGLAFRSRCRVLGRGIRLGRLPRRALFRGNALRHSIHSQDPVGSGAYHGPHRYPSLPTYHRPHRPSLDHPPATNETVNLLRTPR